jgi:hypothetical protein
MKKWIRYFLSISSLLCWIPRTGQMNACAGNEIDYNNWFFNPELNALPELSPFFLSYYSFNGAEFSLDNPQFEELVLKDWKNYSGNLFTEKELKEALFEPNENQKKSSFYLWLLKKPGGSEYYDFLINWSRLHIQNDPWGEVVWTWPDQKFGNAQQKMAAMNCEALLNKLDGIKSDTFLQRRIAYQKLRTIAYYPELKLLRRNEIFSKAFEKGPQDWLYYSAMHYMALTSESDGDIERDEWLAKSAIGSVDKQVRTVQLFDKDNLPELLRSSLPNKVKASAMSLALLRTPFRSLNDLNQLYEYDPQNRYLTFLLHREINKTEQLFMSLSFSDAQPFFETYVDEDNSTFDGKKQVYKEYAEALFAFIGKVKTNRPAENRHYTLMQAWLKMLLADPKACLLKLNEIPKDGQQRNVLLQAAVMQNIAKLQLAAQGEETFEIAEQDIAATCKMWENLNNRTTGETILRDQWLRYAAWHLIKSGRKSKGILLGMTEWNYRTKSYITGEKTKLAGDLSEWLSIEGTASDFDEALALASKPSKTEFESLICSASQSYWSLPSNLRNRVLYLKTMWYTGKDSLEQALNVTAMVPDSIWQKEKESRYEPMGDPFFVNYVGRDYYNKDLPARSMTRPELLKNIIRIKQLAERDKMNEAFWRYFLGNAYLSLSWLGKNWNTVQLGRSNYPQYDKVKFSGYHYGNYAAREYQKVLRISEDPTLGVLAARQLGALYGLKKFMNDEINESDINDYATSTNKNPYYPIIVRSGGGRIFRAFSYRCDDVADYYTKVESRLYPKIR